ncbi:retrovirus-related Pol polyprotein from transposon 17.6 [Trichonephila clavipes]|nr:retrovirus-related Pol polyprotein from transposon 17.6 [Trichonephila clavipes]
MLVIIEEIGEILKWYIDQIMVEMIIGVAIRTTVKEISGSRAGIGFKTMIADLTIGDINLEIEVKMTILMRGDQRNRGSSENFSRGSRKQMGRLNVLKVNDIKEKPGLTHVLYHEIDTGYNPPVVSRPYRYDRLKQEILDYHVDKMLKEGTIIPIQSPYASPVVLYRKNNGLPPDNPEAYRFSVDYRKLNAITKYPRYPLPLIDDLIMNIPHTGIMSALDFGRDIFRWL